MLQEHATAILLLLEYCLISASYLKCTYTTASCDIEQTCENWRWHHRQCAAVCMCKTADFVLLGYSL